MKTLIRPVLVLFILMTVITGVIYPIVVTAIGHAAFAAQANGSLLEKDGKGAGSALIGRQFDARYYFWGRLSATSPQPYNAQNYGGSNIGPTHPALATRIKDRLDAVKRAGNAVS